MKSIADEIIIKIRNMVDLEIYNQKYNQIYNKIISDIYERVHRWI